MIAIQTFSTSTNLSKGDNMNDYRKKSDAELRYILKDAGEAAQAMREIDRNAECKYLDQVNDACTELHRRGKK